MSLILVTSGVVKIANRGSKEGTRRVICSTEFDLLLPTVKTEPGTVIIVRFFSVGRSRSEVKALGRGPLVHE